jgi:short-subunit dehydrogenase
MLSLQQELWQESIGYFVCDIRNKETLQEVFSQISHIDCFINNSGIGYWENTYEESLEHIEDTIQTNLISAMRCTRLALPKMIANNQGVIINIWSVQSTKGRAGASAYGASKAGLKMYTDILREEVKEKNISVIGMYPWKMYTPMRTSEELEELWPIMMNTEEVAKIIFQSYIYAMQWVVQEEIFIRPPKDLSNSAF